MDLTLYTRPRASNEDTQAMLGSSGDATRIRDGVAEVVVGVDRNSLCLKHFGICAWSVSDNRSVSSIGSSIKSWLDEEKPWLLSR